MKKPRTLLLTGARKSLWRSGGVTGHVWGPDLSKQTYDGGYGFQEAPALEGTGALAELGLPL